MDDVFKQASQSGTHESGTDMEKVPPKGVENRESVIKELGGQVGWLSFEAKVQIDSDKKILFLEDIDVETGTIMREKDIQDLFDAGILIEGNSDKIKSNYALASDYNGYVKLYKEELNAAINSGKLVAEIDEDGELDLHL